MKLKLSRSLPIFGAVIFCGLAPVAAHAGQVTFEFNADYRTGSVGDVFSGYYITDGTALAAGLAGNTAAVIPVTSFYLQFDGSTLNNGPAQAGSEVSLPNGGTGWFDIVLNGTSGYIYVDGIVDSSGFESAACLTEVCTVDGTFNGNPGNPGYSQLPVPEPSSMAGLALGLSALLCGTFRRRSVR